MWATFNFALKACAAYQGDVMRGLTCELIQVDEIWAYTYAKQKNLSSRLRNNDEAGDTWTWIAIDSETKLVPCWYVGKRDGADAWRFIKDLSERLAHRVQMTSDGHRPYLQAVESIFEGAIDYAMLVKLYGPPTTDRSAEARYSPPRCIGARRVPIWGQPDCKLISTSHVERQNLTVRMNNRRFTRLTNAFSKKLENYKHSVAIHFMAYNLCRPHLSLRIADNDGAGYIQQTPAMTAKLTDHVWSMEEIVALLP